MSAAVADDVLVCVVDDDASVRNALVRLLGSAGYHVRAYPGAQALLADRSLSCRTPTVVLTDLRMPGIDGLALSEELAARAGPLAILFLSAHGDVRATVRAMKIGAVDFLEKPAREEELFEALGRAVERSREQIRRQEGLRALQEKYESLTPREREVCALVVSGLMNKEVAWELGVSERTIKVHRGRVVRKMGARSLPDLVRMAGQLGIRSDRSGPAHTA